jgi:hypothetical protein
MGRKLYISFKTEDAAYKQAIQDSDLDCVDKSLNVAIDSNDEDYILRMIREDYLSDSTVTIHLIGLYGAENRGWQEQRFIKRELQASLYDGQGNTKNGILGVVLPEAVDSVYRGTYQCLSCGNSHNYVAINDFTTVKEFSYNYYIPNGKCSHAEDDRYCVLVRWSDFATDPERYIEDAFAKRTAPIASKTRVRPT